MIRGNLKEVIHRYSDLEGVLECLCINLINETDKLPKADMVIANLLIEYIGYDCFQKTIRHVDPKYVSCIIQINIEGTWVSDSPYLYVFDGLEQVHHQMEEQELEKAMLPLEDIYRGGNLKSRNPRMQTMLRMVGFGDNEGSGFPSILATWEKEGWAQPELIEDTRCWLNREV